jgi:hypothetical protein
MEVIQCLKKSALDVDLSNPWFWISVASITFNPFFWNVVAQRGTVVPLTLYSSLVLPSSQPVVMFKELTDPTLHLILIVLN